MADLIYYKRNVNYVVGGRFFLGDPQGFTLTNENPYVSVKRDNLRDFKIANKRAIIEGLIVEAEEPSVDWDTTNAITDDDARDLVKNFLQLKKTLERVDSFATVTKILEIAKETDRPTKTIKLIEARAAELADEDGVVYREDMRGVE